MSAAVLSSASPTPASGHRRWWQRLAGALGIGAVVVGTAALGVWATLPGTVAAAPAGLTRPASGATPSAGGRLTRPTAGGRHGARPGSASDRPSTPASPGGTGPAPAHQTPAGQTSGGQTPSSQAPGGAATDDQATGDQATGDQGAGSGASGAGAPGGGTPAGPGSAPAVPAPAPAPAAPVLRGILPPDNPPANITPDPDFLTVCSGTAPDASDACTQAALQAIDNGRAAEGLPPMILPSDWPTLTAAEQLFVATNLERTVRGLAPLSGLDPALDQAAAAGAADGSDPAPPAGYPYAIWASNWAGALGNPLEAIDLWMYDDGPGSANVDCPSAGAAGCWGHRDNILVSLPCNACAMGAALDPTGWEGDPAWAELLVESQDQVSTVFTWSDVTPYLPADEA